MKAFKSSPITSAMQVVDTAIIFGLVHVVGVGEAVDHVVEAAEHRGVFGHRRGDAGRRLLEVTREMRAVIGDATLRAVDEGNGLFEADGDENRAERLAGLGRIDGQSFAGEILFLVFRGLGPFAHPLDFRRVTRIFEHLPLVRQHFLVFRTAEQVEVVEDVIGVLSHDFALCCRSFAAGARLSDGAPATRGHSAARSLDLESSFQGALAIFQTGALMAMSMSRAKIAKPS